MSVLRILFVVIFTSVCSAQAVVGDDLLIDDFESDSYGEWSITGDAFGAQPAPGTLANQMPVSGFRGQGLINTFVGGDATTGTATSPPFTIGRRHLAFLIGGGARQDSVGIELLVDGKSVRAATGAESEELQWSSWDVGEFAGRRARVRIYDRATGGWGHLLVDHLVQTDDPPKRFDLEYQLSKYRQSADYLREPLRPQYHFSPEINWMNDPNGLVFHDGEYHLFYQYNPAGNSWGHMSWGHAVSADLTHWEHLPLAIPEADGIMAFSGCCVVDHHNSSGFGRGDQPAMVAIYTGHGHGKQVQNLAYSNDNGRTWTKYAGNPVLDIDNPDFRDPKVFWHEATDRWVMVVSLAKEKVVVFYASKDLKDWSELSRFGPAGVAQKSNWECPDLFELPVEGGGGKSLWVLEVDMGSGSVAGGSGGEYFVGHFDGTRFTATQDAKWVDFGRDFYAPVSWSDIPQSDGRRIWIGWFNNWQTCLVPTSPWRSCMSVPRTLSLRKTPGRDDLGRDDSGEYVLVQRPVKELQRLRVHSRSIQTHAATWPPVAVTKPGELTDRVFELETTLKPGTARSVGLRIRTGDDEFTEVGYDREPGAVYVDRRKSGNVAFHQAFAGRHEAPVRVLDGEVSLRLLVDRSSIEVFINDGEAVISDRIFPSGQKPTIEVFAGDESAQVTATTLHVLSSIWHPSVN
ncbi:glycoside hydrolase family 32 protein [Stieleria sp. ICT_E10.1]|uniref:glycoside hydrolase family 32 protein n=1 Tax=Stieleria sedimenti TaxID=2976331 RepID=UPI00218022E0|nr:glycoside hydrolase family 32 protein [Stieleria sedimenti]MCS7468483.1 glycoside hydrolase family 32 protein [Stieleria sedimenti]